MTSLQAAKESHRLRSEPFPDVAQAIQCESDLAFFLSISLAEWRCGKFPERPHNR